MIDLYREWDAAYVLGALSAEERLEFEAHLDECDRCRGSVAELAGMPGILAKLPAAEAVASASPGLQAPPHAAPFAELGIVQRLARTEVRRRRWRVMAAAAAVVLVAIGGLWASNALAPASPAQAMTAIGQNVITAQLAVTSEAYGSRIVWSCQYPGGWGEKNSYDLVVIDAAGKATTVASWSSGGDASGLAATTAIPAGTIRSVEVRLTGSDAALLRENF